MRSITVSFGLGLLIGLPAVASAAPPEDGHEHHVHDAEVVDRHEHHEHESDEALHGGRVRQVIVEVPTDGSTRPQVAGSDMDIPLHNLSKVPRTTAEDLMTLAPGVSLVNAGGEGHPSTMYLRGFEAGEGQDVSFSVEGVPVNDHSNPHGHGFADTSFLIPELVTHLRFTQGSYDATQGDFAVAGSAGYSLGLEQRGVRVRGEYGRFNTGRALVLWGPEDMESGTFFGADFRSGDGFGANRDHMAARTMAGYAHTFGRHTHLRVLGQSSGTQFRQPTPLRLDDFEAGRLPCGAGSDEQIYCTYDDSPRGTLTRSGVSARIFRHDSDRVFSQGVFLFRRSTYIRENFTGFLNDPSGDGLEQSHGGWTAGARGSYGMRTQWRDRTQGIDFGYDLRYDSVDTRLSRFSASDGEIRASLFDNKIDVVNPAVYVSAPLAPTAWLDLNIGFRLEFFAVGLERQAGDEPDATAFAIAPLPRTSATVKLRPWLHWVNAYGLGVRSPDANGLSAGGLVEPMRSHSTETGFRAMWSDLGDGLDLDARAVGFYTHVEQDLVFDEGAGRNLPIGASNRFGIMGALHTEFAGWLDLRASATWSEAYLPPDDAGAFEWTAGERLPFIPRLTVRGDAALWHGFTAGAEHFTWNLGVGAGYISPRTLPIGTGNAITVVDLGGGMRWRWIELGVEIQNLLDARYRNVELVYASNFDSPTPEPSELPMMHFLAGEPFTVMGSLTLHFEPGELTHYRADRRTRELRGGSG